MNWQLYRANIIRMSLFRWRWEWALLALAAGGLVISEQAREVRDRDPYQLMLHGRTAAAVVEGGRAEQVTTAVRRGEPIVETRTYLDLSWFDDRQLQRRVDDYRLDPETVQGLNIDTALKRWPAYVNIQYLEAVTQATARSADLNAPQPQGVTAPQFQKTCRPSVYCRLVVLLPRGKARAERDADFVDLALEWGPRAMWVSLIAFFTLLSLRFQGVIDNRPSLE